VGDPLDLLRTWSGDHATLLRLFYEQDNLLCGTANALASPESEVRGDHHSTRGKKECETARIPDHAHDHFPPGNCKAAHQELQCIAAEGSTLQHIAKNSSISPGLA
jgi:hypothetical protein